MGEMAMNEAETMLEMLGGRERAARTIAVVGLSDDRAKASHGVSAYMQAQGYKILPVNPLIKSVLGETCYASLRDLPEKPGLKNLWVQFGIWSDEAAAKAEKAGIRVVMDRCIMVEHRLLLR
jgi:predicted CoA-binding protein